VGDSELRAAYEDLLRRYLAALRRLAWSYARDGFEDLFQEIAMALWTALPRFRGESSERTWVYRVAHNTAISFVASRRRRDRREQTGDGLNEAASTANPEGDVLAQERRKRLWAAVRALPMADRQIVVLYLEGLTASEIATVTDLSAIAVATRLTRIRQKLTTHVRREEDRS
jgi:RNA polymerase sigma factor (sigma-70 family)